MGSEQREGRCEMNRITLLDDLVSRMKKVFTGYMLPNKSGVLQEVRVFGQYVPQPQGLTFGEKSNAGLKNYGAADYEENFPCVVVRLGEMTDSEERSLTQSGVNVTLLFGVYDDGVECQGYRDVLNMQESVRVDLLEHRVLAGKHMLMMPVKSRLLEAETWPVYFGELDLVYQVGRPMQGYGWVERHAR